MKNLVVVLLTLFCFQVNAQYYLKISVADRATGELLSGVTAQAKGVVAISSVSDSKGDIILRNMPGGTHIIIISYSGYKESELAVTLPDTTMHTVLLQQDEKELAGVVVVASTRGNERIENATIKVEVLGQEEMNEESMVKPGNITSILGDISGVQIQQSSATSGNSNIRIQGLDGRYTQILRDGMPFYDGFSGGFGVLSIPPLDLKQLELIKGSASTLYGGGAIGGLINFISKKPTSSPEASFVFNHSTLQETNMNAYYAQRWKRVGFTLFAGQTYQEEKDVDKDGLSDVPKINSTLVHPVLFIYPSAKSYISMGWSGSFEKRIGGDMIALAGKKDASHPFFEKNKLSRNTYTLIAENHFSNAVTGTVKASYSVFNRDLSTNTYVFNASQQNLYAEASFNARKDRHSLVGGINITSDMFRPSLSTPAPVGGLSNSTVGIFVQDAIRLSEATKLEAGLRIDQHNKYGTFILPRIAVFHRLNEAWGTRVGIGMGYKTPNPLTPQVKDYDIYNILPLAAGVSPERSLGANAEINYKKNFGKDRSLFINNAFFLTNISHPVIATEGITGLLSFNNEMKPLVTKGFDTYIQLKLGNWEAYLGYTYTIAERKYLDENQFVPLTPRHRAAATLVYEPDHSWRFGLEGSFNGRQYRDGDSKTPSYFFVAAMIEKKFGPKLSLVLNCENALDERQSKYENLFTGSISNPNYKPLWAPIDGRVINLAIRFKPFSD